jgi:hypothetical protein
MSEPVTWLKAKYSAPKQKGRYHSTHNDQGNKKKTKVGRQTKPVREHVLTITATGKRSWSWRAV